MSDKRKISASQLLEHFMFTPDMQFTEVHRLSGGEKRRLYLLTVLMKNPNFLILDEPTNDLDLLTLTKLEEFLLNYMGCLILVSHDRFFMDKLIDHLFIFKGNGVIEDYYSNYSDYRQEQLEVQKQIKKVKNLDKKKSKSKLTSNKFTFNEKFEYENLEKEIKKLELEKSELELRIQDSNLIVDEMNVISKRLGEIVDLIEIKEYRWMELEEKRCI